MQVNTVVQADALTFLRTLPDASVDCVVTSPPYFGLRDYGVDGQIGLEDTPAAYVARLVDVFVHARRAMKDSATLWLNLGDSYSGSGKGGQSDKKRSSNWQPEYTNKGANYGLPPKSLLMIPARVALALQDAGFILRAEIVWHKPAPMPESVKDRPTRSHEMVYLLAKQGNYFYDADAIAEPSKESSLARLQRAVGSEHKHVNGAPGQTPHTLAQPRPNVRKGGGNFSRKYAEAQPTHGSMALERGTYELRNARDVWTMHNESTPFVHFATMPMRLVERCILAGCPPGGVVLDPFMGSGTTALVARRIGRQYIGCDLNAEYVALAERRLAQPYTVPMFDGMEAAK